jgi:chromosome segregation ATPase
MRGAFRCGKLRPSPRHRPALADKLDTALTARLREVLASDRVTESQLRELTDEAEEWSRTLEAQVLAGERRLTRLTANPESSIVEIAGVLRKVERLRPALDEVRTLVSELDTRARELRTAWLRAAQNG